MRKGPLWKCLWLPKWGDKVVMCAKEGFPVEKRDCHLICLTFHIKEFSPIYTSKESVQISTYVPLSMSTKHKSASNTYQTSVNTLLIGCYHKKMCHFELWYLVTSSLGLFPHSKIGSSMVILDEFSVPPLVFSCLMVISSPGHNHCWFKNNPYPPGHSTASLRQPSVWHQLSKSQPTRLCQP